MDKEHLIQINKFSHLHNGRTIIFCKTDFILQEFSNIEALGHDVIFITGNSDYCITDDLVQKAPKNIKAWFCQNKLSNHPLLTALPLGIENTVPCSREGHGYVWPHALEKPDKLCEAHNKLSTNLAYANFNVQTNYETRNRVRNICQSSSNSHITWEEPTKPYSDFIQGVLNHKMVVCPQGNGPGDNHRIYESLYLNRIPITFNRIQYDNLHNKFPLLCISEDKLTDAKWLEQEADKINKDNYALNINYWINKITDAAKRL